MLEKLREEKDSY